MVNLTGKVCLVTGATRGIGKGIALQLGQSGATVYITGRTLKSNGKTPGSLQETAKEIESRGGKCIPVQCDHNKDEEIQKLFEQIKTDQNGKLDILVNNAFAAVKVIADNMGTPFWEQPLDVWDTVNSVGLRNHYMCSIYASRMMVPKKQGLIVNISSVGGLRYLFNIPYGVGKQAVDRMAVDCAVELKKHNVTCVSMWPGAVQTESMLESVNSGNITLPEEMKSVDVKKMIENGESPEYVGKAVSHLAADPNVHKKTGKILMTTDLGYEYGFTDADGRQPSNMRCLKTALQADPKTVWMSKFVPGFIHLPRVMFTLAGNKF